MQDEIALALDENKTIVPVFYRECKTPLRLRRLQWVDFSGDFQAALKELLEDLKVAPWCDSQSQPPPKKIITPPEGMVLISAGWFLMGSNEREEEKPIHKVYVDAFFMDKYQVTVEEYQRFLKATYADNPEHWSYQIKFPKRPIVFVSWNDAQVYAEWAGKRLPTEAEWEFAARGGYNGLGGEPRYEYPWGDMTNPSEANFNTDGERDYEWSDKQDYLKDVGSYPSNGYGLYDMAGNVWEWCMDWFDENYYNMSPEHNPQGPEKGSERVLRGGSWIDLPQSLRCTNRCRKIPSDRSCIVGFRCAQDVR